MQKFEKHLVPTVFLILVIGSIYFSGASPNYIIDQLYARFIRNGVIVIALLIPIMVGMGINFAITIGAISAQIGLIFALDFQIEGFLGLIFALVVSLVISYFAGILIAWVMNKAKGKEMICGIVISYLGTNLYHLIFMVGYGTIIPPRNSDMVLSTGVGLRNMLDSAMYRDVFHQFFIITIGNIKIAFLPIFVIILSALFVFYISRTRFGYQLRVVGESLEKAEMLGIDVNKVRKRAIIISTMLAAIGQILFIQNMGVINVYTGHLNINIFAAAALMAGGATLKEAKIRHAFQGLILYHTLFILSPIAGQNIFQNVALGEYFRSFVAYSTIVFALAMSMRKEEMEESI